MRKEKIKIASNQFQSISKNLEERGFSENEINQILNNDFSTFENENDLSEVFKDKNNYQSILRLLSDGYTIDQLEGKGIRSQDIDKFKNMLKDSNLTIENAKAINQYSNGSNMILSLKRGTVSREEIRQGIIDDLISKLQERSLNKEVIIDIQRNVEKLDYQRPVHENYDVSRESLDKLNIPNNCYPSINTAIKHLDSYNHIDETITQLDDGLSKARLPRAMKLYRAVKSKSTTSVKELVERKEEDKGYTSTSPLYDASFAKYDEYDTVMELYAPKGTKGIYIVPFSDYDNVEQEVLLNSNEVFFTNAQEGVVDKNGKTKNILKGLLLSKDMESYKDLDKQVSEADKNQAANDKLQEHTEERIEYSSNSKGAISLIKSKGHFVMEKGGLVLQELVSRAEKLFHKGNKVDRNQSVER